MCRFLQFCLYYNCRNGHNAGFTQLFQLPRLTSFHCLLVRPNLSPWSSIRPWSSSPLSFVLLLLCHDIGPISPYPNISTWFCFCPSNWRHQTASSSSHNYIVSSLTFIPCIVPCIRFGFPCIRCKSFNFNRFRCRYNSEFTLLTNCK